MSFEDCGWFLFGIVVGVQLCRSYFIIRGQRKERIWSEQAS
jgi:hypothetical protein